MVVELEMNLYSRDYRSITSSELEKYQAILKLETEGQPIGRINMYDSYPTAVKHYLSLFPNNHIRPTATGRAAPILSVGKFSAGNVAARMAVKYGIPTPSTAA